MIYTSGVGWKLAGTAVFVLMVVMSLREVQGTLYVTPGVTLFGPKPEITIFDGKTPKRQLSNTLFHQPTRSLSTIVVV